MKFIRYRSTEGAGCFCVGIEHEHGRVQRIFETRDTSAEADTLSRRAVDALRACEGIGAHTLAKMAEGGTKVGDLAERAMIVSMLFHYSPRAYERMRKLALEAITKEGGTI